MLVALIATSFSAMAEDIYIVAGSEELCGTAWDCTDLNNKMTDNGDGTYSKTFTNVAAMNGYQFKVTKMARNGMATKQATTSLSM